MGLRISPSVVCIESKKPIETIATGAASVVVVIIVVTVVVAYAHSRTMAKTRAKRAICDKQDHAQIPPAEREGDAFPSRSSVGRVWPKISTIDAGAKKRLRREKHEMRDLEDERERLFAALAAFSFCLPSP